MIAPHSRHHQNANALRFKSFAYKLRFPASSVGKGNGQFVAFANKTANAVVKIPKVRIVVHQEQNMEAASENRPNKSVHGAKIGTQGIKKLGQKFRYRSLRPAQ